MRYLSCIRFAISYNDERVCKGQSGPRAVGRTYSKQRKPRNTRVRNMHPKSLCLPEEGYLWGMCPVTRVDRERSGPKAQLNRQKEQQRNSKVNNFSLELTSLGSRPPVCTFPRQTSFLHPPQQEGRHSKSISLPDKARQGELLLGEGLQTQISLIPSLINK